MVPGDRIVTPSGRTGVLQQSTFNMPHHHLIRFDSGEVHWVVKHAVAPCSATSPKKRSIKAKSKKKTDNLIVLSHGCKLVEPNPTSLQAE